MDALARVEDLSRSLPLGAPASGQGAPAASAAPQTSGAPAGEAHAHSDSTAACQLMLATGSLLESALFEVSLPVISRPSRLGRSYI